MSRLSFCIYLIFAVVFVSATAESLCQRLATGSGSQKAFMQQFVGLSMASITNSVLSPYFDGVALDRNGNNVTNYVGNNTLYQQLISSHVQYYGKLFNCTDSSFPEYTGLSMEAAHAKLKISASLFEQYQLLSMNLLPIVTFGRATTEVEMEVSELFEKHRGIVAADRICNEDDCQQAVLTLDSWENLIPMFLNVEERQALTIVNSDTATCNFTVLNITADSCSPMGELITVAAGTNVTTSALEELPAGDYYFGKWPSDCMLGVASVSPMISQIRIRPTPGAPVEAPIEPPVEAPVEPPIEAPVKPPVEAPVEPPVEAPVEPPAQAPTQPPKAPASPPVETPMSAPVNSPVNGPAAQPVATPESHENDQHDLTPVVIILSIAVAILLGVVIFLVFKLKKKEPHYEIIND